MDLVEITDLDDDAFDVLQARADDAGLPLEDYLRERLEAEARRESVPDLRPAQWE